MDININLAGQEPKNFRTIYLVLGITGFIVITLTMLLPDFKLKHFYYSWIVFLPGIIEAILYGLGKKRILANHFPYLKINEERIEKSKGGIFAKPEIYDWSNIKSLDIKLFELQLTTTTNQQATIDLTQLTDDNLKIVKEYVTSMKKKMQL